MSKNKFHDNPEHVSTTWIARKHCRSAETIRREIKSGKLRCGEKFNGDYMIRYEDYLEWKAKYFKSVAS